jgi:hypothetical protein
VIATIAHWRTHVGTGWETNRALAWVVPVKVEVTLSSVLRRQVGGRQGEGDPDVRIGCSDLFVATPSIRRPKFRTLDNSRSTGFSFDIIESRVCLSCGARMDSPAGRGAGRQIHDPIPQQQTDHQSPRQTATLILTHSGVRCQALERRLVRHPGDSELGYPSQSEAQLSCGRPIFTNPNTAIRGLVF